MANYLPSVDEVYSRGEALRWMLRMEWDWGTIDQVLHHDNPTPDRLRELVYQHGPIRAYQLLFVGEENESSVVS